MVDDALPWEMVEDDLPWEMVDDALLPWEMVEDDLPWEMVDDDLPWGMVKDDLPREIVPIGCTIEYSLYKKLIRLWMFILQKVVTFPIQNYKYLIV